MGCLLQASTFCSPRKVHVKVGWGPGSASPLEVFEQAEAGCGSNVTPRVLHPCRKSWSFPQTLSRCMGLEKWEGSRAPPGANSAAAHHRHPKKTKTRWVEGANQAPRGLVEEAGTPRSVPALGTNPTPQPLYRMLLPWPWRGDGAGMKAAHTMPLLGVFAAKRDREREGDPKTNP